MGEAANVFNSFSFGKWSELKKEEELDKESRRRRNAQIKRLKEQLAEERRLRELGGNGDGDLDFEALIEALQRGEEINEGIPQKEIVRIRASDGYDDDDELPQLDEYGDRTDDDILSEIRQYQRQHTGPPGTVHGADDRFWRYNRRYAEAQPVPRAVSNDWKYNKRHTPEARPPSAKPKEPEEQSFRYNRVVTK